MTKSNVLEFRTNKNSQIHFSSKNNSLDNISENFREGSANITNLQSEQQSETKFDLRVASQYGPDRQDLGQDFDQLSQRLMTHENSKLKDFIDTNNFSCIKSGIGNENLRNFLEESKMDSFFRQIANFPSDSLHLRDHL